MFAGASKSLDRREFIENSSRIHRQRLKWAMQKAPRVRRIAPTFIKEIDEASNAGTSADGGGVAPCLSRCSAGAILCDVRVGECRSGAACASGSAGGGRRRQALRLRWVSCLQPYSGNGPVGRVRPDYEYLEAHSRHA